ncbi:MAG: protein-lysine N-methyltransferase [Candidatus Obscuribacterales bacterium]|nr:protein-lysine N-methyltransferase [Candidatus Obscuribacterales bacterium]
MHELHENEQYFFSDKTLKKFCDLLRPFANPCILCAPTLAEMVQETVGSQKSICALDIDTRFEKTLPGFRLWNLYKPTRMDERFDVIFCDPPFFNCSLSQLFTAIRLLSDFDYSQPIMICYLLRREQALLGTFAKFSLAPSGIYASYKTVQDSERNTIQLYSNTKLITVAEWCSNRA